MGRHPHLSHGPNAKTAPDLASRRPPVIGRFDHLDGLGILMKHEFARAKCFIAWVSADAGGGDPDWYHNLSVSISAGK
jgi:hypothetical protein